MFLETLMGLERRPMVSYASAPMQNALLFAGMSTYFGTASPPTSYGGYGGARLPRCQRAVKRLYPDLSSALLQIADHRPTLVQAMRSRMPSATSPMVPTKPKQRKRRCAYFPPACATIALQISMQVFL